MALSPEERYRRIAERAYLLAEAAGFPATRDLEFWLAAEAAQAAEEASPTDAPAAPAAKKGRKKS